MAPRVWVYVKVYVHDRPEMLDWLVVAALPKIREQLAGSRWFFLRYFDASGVHLRVRFEVAATAADRVRALLVGELTIAYAELDRSGFDGFDWFAPRLRRAGTQRSTATAVTCDEYVPEYATYGHAEMPVAEDLFCRSSELVSEQLVHRYATGGSDAKLAALDYMRAVSRVFVAEHDEESFWTEYRDYWLGSNAALAATLRTAITRSAERATLALRSASIPSCSRWRAALEDAAQRYAGAAGASALRQFVHLTNNRLGITLVEESYMAQLLLSLRCVAR